MNTSFNGREKVLAYNLKAKIQLPLLLYLGKKKFSFGQKIRDVQGRISSFLVKFKIFKEFDIQNLKDLAFLDQNSPNFKNLGE